MNLEHLKLFVAVYRAGGFAPVAEELNVAPSSVSRTIAALEAELAARLFHRTTRKLTPTEAGEAYFRRVAPLVEELELARQEAEERAHGPAGRLRVTCSTSFGKFVVAPHLKAFHDLYPDIQLEIIMSDRQLDLVDERIDVAIRHGSLPDSSMISRKLMDVAYFLVASPAYLDAAPPLDTPEDIGAHRTVSFMLDSFRSRWRFRRGGEVREISINPVVAANNAFTLVQCARDGLGVAVVADWNVAEELASGRLVRILPDWEAAGASFDVSVWLLFPSRAYIPEKARVFADFLVEQCRGGG